MIKFYFHTTPNPAKVALMLEETDLPYEVVPIDIAKGDQHSPAFRAVNPNGKVPAIIDTDGPGGQEVRVFDSTAILLYLSEKTHRFAGSPQTWPEMLSWLLFIASGLGPFFGQAVHFQYAAPEPIPYAINRYRREAERHLQVLNQHMEGRAYILGDDYSIADMSAWGWLERVPRVLKGDANTLAAYPNLKRLFDTISARPAAERAKALTGQYSFKTVGDEDSRRALYPSNYPAQA